MTNRQRVIAAVKAKAPKRLRDEIAYYLDTYSDAEWYDEADALNDALNNAEANYDRAMVRDCIDLLIVVGFYQPRDGEVVVMGRDRAPTRGGVKYDCVDSWYEWIQG